MRRIAFFGGSFDPPHRGHLAIASAAADRLALDQVLFATAGRQPLKGKYPATEFIHRYAMTVLATQSDTRFIPSLLDAPLEAGNGETRPNYTVETLARLRALLDSESEPTALFTLLGADSWLDIGRWFQAPRLLALADWIVASRPGFSLASVEAALPAEVIPERCANIGDGATRDSTGDPVPCDLILHHGNAAPTRVWFLPHLQEDISATELRASLDQGKVDREFLPESVQNYLVKTGIYSSIALKDSAR